MKTYSPPVRGRKTESPGVVVDRLIQRYRASATEASGLLHAIAERYVNGDSSVDREIVDFMILAGDASGKPWESDPALREKARQLIYRRIIPTLLRDVSRGVPAPVARTVSFLSVHDGNGPVEESDRGLVNAFLERCWNFQHTHEGVSFNGLVEASIRVGYLQRLKADPETIITLRKYLLKKLPSEVRNGLRGQQVSGAVGEGELQTDKLYVPVAGMILASNLADLYGTRAGKLLSLHAEWICGGGAIRLF